MLFSTDSASHNQYTPHNASRVYSAAFITSDECVKLYKDALFPQTVPVNQYSPHNASSVYSAAFITSDARVKLYKDALFHRQCDFLQ